jgi:hypothetical protein
MLPALDHGGEAVRYAALAGACQGPRVRPSPRTEAPAVKIPTPTDGSLRERMGFTHARALLSVTIPHRYPQIMRRPTAMLDEKRRPRL